ncbi:MAG: polymer-forming cytoskeletal protein [Ignavibacteriaceae bacterium]
MKSIYGDGVKSDETTIISSGVKIEGTVTTNGNIRVDGEIKGDIISDNNISIGDSGIVNGKINAAVVTIGGVVTGSIAAKEKLTLTSRGKINGDVVVKSFVIEDGGLFNGNCKMGGSVGTTQNNVDSKPMAIKN